MRRDRNQIVEVPVDRVTGATRKAIFVIVEGTECSVGKSVVENFEEMEEYIREKDPPDIQVPAWVAIQNEWLDEEDL